MFFGGGCLRGGYRSSKKCYFRMLPTGIPTSTLTCHWHLQGHLNSCPRDESTGSMAKMVTMFFSFDFWFKNDPRVDCKGKTLIILGQFFFELI